ncbi:hypothetical protein PROSTU_01057 [Providencia stuartii ATCC 25827]|uniref:Integrase catalytic domain-containing protein n=2 Tax=Providencia stuartii TaxID=588 RepID=A0AA86YVJ0_PROST|nr:hypothetical protein PROSTU_01057 [Providencia stuartii ATCC 25827]
MDEYSEPRTHLWSFEVKKRINMSNVREVFFQTLSNSSWANVGYLVAAEITGDETLKELTMRCAAHSIGGILLDKEEIANTQILIQATEKENVDWDIMIDYIKLGCPYQNAYIERFNRTYRDDVLNCYIFNNLNEVKQITEDWIELYNNERPHDSLNDMTPFEYRSAA